MSERVGGGTRHPLGEGARNLDTAGGQLGFLNLARTLRDERRALGWRGVLKKRGWKLIVVLVLIYLVRDLVLYVIVPLGTAAWLFR